METDGGNGPKLANLFTSKAHTSLGERGPLLDSNCRDLLQGRSFKVSAIAAGTAGVLAAARVLAAAPWLIHILGLIALVARVALLGVLPGAALLGGVLVAASAASGTLSW